MKKIILSSFLLFAISCKDKTPQQNKEPEIIIKGELVIIPKIVPYSEK